MATTAQTNKLPDSGFVRIWDVVGDKKRGISPRIPIGRTTFLNHIKAKKWPYLKPYKLGERTTVYKVDDIRRLIEELGGENE